MPETGVSLDGSDPRLLGLIALVVVLLLAVLVAARRAGRRSRWWPRWWRWPRASSNLSAG